MKLRSLAARLLRRGARAPSPYADELIRLFWTFVHERYPDEAVPEDEFAATVLGYVRGGAVRPNNRYLGDLWQLFEPDFRRRLGEYYAHFALHNTLTFLSYAADPVMIEENYVRPYRIARAELGPGEALEVGAGIPHGLVHEQLAAREPVASRLTVVDVEAPYTAFAEWFCSRAGIPFAFVRADAGKTTVLPEGARYDFVFAKDVLEHLERPVEMVEEIVRHAAEGAILALDVEDKGAVVYGHVSPDLAGVRARMADLGWTVLARSGNVTLYRHGGG